MPRGQIELWMLTKFGMIFFIIALGAIIFMFQLSSREKICSDQTQVIASAVTGRIAQVLDSPAEDERRTYAFPLALQLGQNDLTRYEVDITLFNPSQGANYLSAMGGGNLIVNASPVGQKGCEKGSSLHFDNFIFQFSAANRPNAGPSQLGVGSTLRYVMHASPSYRETATEKRSRYLVIIKCSEKDKPPGDPDYKRHLFIQDCTNDDVNQCASIADLSQCDFPPTN